MPLFVVCCSVAVFGGLGMYYEADSWLISLGYGAATGVGLAAAAAVAWWITGTHPWPDRASLRFVAVHAGGLAFGMSSPHVADRLIGAVVLGRSLPAYLFEGERLLWGMVLWGGLYASFVGLSYAARAREEIHQHRLASAVARADATQAQLDALRGQLNPHFLFNALHSIAQLVSEDPRAAEEVLERMGAMLRYALDDEEWDVPLSEEWEFTQLYLSIEDLRFGDTLEVSTELDDAALSCPVPRFTLQPLVENAVQHGVSRKPGLGRIRVTAHGPATDQQVEQPGGLRITVVDDGPGVERVDRVFDEGTGLRNLRERLQARFGAAAGLAVTSAPGQGFRVDVTLPT